MADRTIPLATMGEVQENVSAPNPLPLLNSLRLVADDQRVDFHARATAETAWEEIKHLRHLLTRLSDFMRRCNPERCKPGEDATDDEWDAIEAEINAAIGKTGGENG
jgi:hypothetical protein